MLKSMTLDQRESDTTSMTFADYLRQEMEWREWSQSKLAREINQAPSLVSRWLRGQRPASDSVRNIAAALGVSEEWLLSLAGYLSAPAEDDDPRRAALIAKVRLIDLTEDRYALLDALLEAMRRRRISQDSKDGIRAISI
jgi:transcriptional regulator with XRE-family HTH domain